MREGDVHQIVSHVSSTTFVTIPNLEVTSDRQHTPSLIIHLSFCIGLFNHWDWCQRKKALAVKLPIFIQNEQSISLIFISWIRRSFERDEHFSTYTLKLLTHDQLRGTEANKQGSPQNQFAPNKELVYYNGTDDPTGTALSSSILGKRGGKEKWSSVAP